MCAATDTCLIKCIRSTNGGFPSARRSFRATFAVPEAGSPPFAVSNPIYVDGDGDGAYRAVHASGAFATE